MKVIFSRKQLTIITILFLVVVGTCTHLIQEGFLANIHSQGMMRLAKEHWDKGEYFNSLYWYRSAYSTAFMGGLRWEIYKIYGYQIAKLHDEGNLSDALDLCWQATEIWNQEGATSFGCLELEQEMLSPK